MFCTSQSCLTYDQSRPRPGTGAAPDEETKLTGITAARPSTRSSTGDGSHPSGP